MVDKHGHIRPLAGVRRAEEPARALRLGVNQIVATEDHKAAQALVNNILFSRTLSAKLV
jgi:hypothetical protein